MAIHRATWLNNGGLHALVRGEKAEVIEVKTSLRARDNCAALTRAAAYRYGSPCRAGKFQMVGRCVN
jgi:hypothetical protein